MRRRTPRFLTAAALAVGLSVVGAAPAQAALATPAPVAGCPVNVFSLFEYDGTLYFTGDSSESYSAIWKLEGTSCVQVTPTEMFSVEIFDTLEYNGALQTATTIDSSYGHYTFDGTTLTPVVAGGDSLDEECFNMVLFDGEMYCTAYNGGGGDLPLFSYDGTDYTNHFTSGAGNIPTRMEGRPVVYDGLLYFAAENAINELRLYRYDGTTFFQLSVVLLSDELFVHDGELYFAAANGLASAVFRSDGITATELPGSDLGYDDMEFVSYLGDLYFRADNGDDDYLFRWNGTAVERVTGGLVGNDVPDDPENPIVFDGLLLMNADGPDTTNVLYAWNGSTWSVVSATARNMESPLVFDGALYFSSDLPSGEGERVLWRLGTTSATPEPELADTGTAGDGSTLAVIAGLMLAAGAAVLTAQRMRTVRRSL